MMYWRERIQAGKGLIKVDGKPLSLLQPEMLRFKVYEPILILGLDKFGTCVKIGNDWSRKDDHEHKEIFEVKDKLS